MRKLLVVIGMMSFLYMLGVAGKLEQGVLPMLDGTLRMAAGAACMWLTFERSCCCETHRSKKMVKS